MRHMTKQDRSAALNGQLVNELRSRDQSGYLFEEIELLRLIESIDGPCWATGSTAVALNRLDGFVLRPPFHVLVPRGSDLRRRGHIIHTSIDIPPIDREQCRRIPLSPTRALMAAAVSEPTENLRSALAHALREGLTSEELMHRRLNSFRETGRYGLPRLLGILEELEICRGGASWLEQEFLRLIARAGIPRPETQQVLTRRGDKIVRVDFVWPSTNVVVEALGYRWHRTGAQMDIDARRMNALVLAGYRCLQFTYAQIVNEAEAVVSALREALGALAIAA
jgi:Protein of unknown function (DUF559)